MRRQQPQEFAEVPRRLDGKVERLGTDRMQQRKPGRAQRLAAKAAEAGSEFIIRAGRYRQPATVDRITDQRVPAPRKMHPYLVGAARFEANVDMGVRRMALAHRVMRDRRLAVVVHSHAQPIDRMAPDRRIDGTAGRQDAMTNCLVVPRDVTRSQHLRQPGMGRQ